MSFRIERQGEKLLVRVVNVACNEQQFLDTVQACKGRSWWSCPSGECAKIGACDAQHDGETLLLTMTPCTGEALSVAGIEECLRYVLDESGKAPLS